MSRAVRSAGRWDIFTEFIPLAPLRGALIYIYIYRRRTIRSGYTLLFEKSSLLWSLDLVSCIAMARTHIYIWGHARFQSV